MGRDCFVAHGAPRNDGVFGGCRPPIALIDAAGYFFTLSER
jgi:hypothetical protein